jgi:glutathione synthase/RimK-type ligase-like ATP-grasp enzyme
LEFTTKIHGIGTILVNKNQIDLLDKNFAPTMFQEYIKKDFEVRVFFFLDRIYSMAIFSQLDKKTSIDFRNYNRKKPNRFVPFILESEILSKIKKFIEVKGIRSGSIDLIFSKKQEYIFLELNPQGQFNWLSEYCNYHIEKEIAEMLINFEQ